MTTSAIWKRGGGLKVTSVRFTEKVGTVAYWNQLSVLPQWFGSVNSDAHKHFISLSYSCVECLLDQPRNHCEWWPYASPVTDLYFSQGILFSVHLIWALHTQTYGTLIQMDLKWRVHQGHASFSLTQVQSHTAKVLASVEFPCGWIYPLTSAETASCVSMGSSGIRSQNIRKVGWKGP